MLLKPVNLNGPPCINKPGVANAKAILTPSGTSLGNPLGNPGTTAFSLLICLLGRTLKLDEIPFE